MHFPKPFFRTARNAWFVQIGDRQIKLAVDKDEAFTRYHELMANPRCTRPMLLRGEHFARVMTLPMSNGESITDAASRNPELASRVSQAIPNYARVTSVEHFHDGGVRVDMVLELREISRIVEAGN